MTELRVAGRLKGLRTTGGNVRPRGEPGDQQAPQLREGMRSKPRCTLDVRTCSLSPALTSPPQKQAAPRV